MKRTFYPIFLLSLLGGCTSEVPSQNALEGDAVPLVISSIRIDSEVSTRTSDITLAEGRLGIFQTSGSQYIPTPYLYTGIDGNWTASPPLPLGPDEAAVCAWLPEDYFVPTTTDDLAHFPLKAQIYDEAFDLAFLGTTGGLNKQHPLLNVRLTHAYALLSFTLKRDITYKGAGVVTGITLNKTNLVHTALIDIRDGSFSMQETASNLPLGVSATVTDDKTPIIKILVPPQTFTDTKLMLEVDGKTLSGTISGTSIGELQSGKSRTFDVTLQRNLELTVSVLPVDGTAGGNIIW